MCLAVPVLGGAAHVAAARHAAGSADAAALAAADAMLGWIDSEPCEIARTVATANHTTLSSCDVDERSLSVRVQVTVGAPFGAATAKARAGSEISG